MIVALKITKQDQEQAQRLLDWIESLGGLGERKLVCWQEQGTDRIAADQAMFYRDDFKSFPQTDNYVFQQIAGYCQDILKEPFLYLEADVVPFTGWLDAIQAAYVESCKARKPFMGDLVQIDGLPNSMAPIGVYPANITDFAGEAMIAHDDPWPIAAAVQMKPWFQKTPLIRHIWENDTLPEGAVLVHPDTDGKILSNLLAQSAVKGSGVGPMSPELSEQSLSPASVRDQTSDEATQAGAGGFPASDGKVYPANTVLPPGVQPCLVVRSEPRARAENFERFEIKDGQVIPINPSWHPQVPWESKPDSIEEIQRLCARLKEFETCPAYTALVRRELKAAKVVR